MNANPILTQPRELDLTQRNDLDHNSRYRIHHDWSSPYLEHARDVTVYLPEIYDAEPERSFPVLYMHDGQNLFDGRLSYVPGSTWRAGATLDTCIAEGLVEPLILVGIANAGSARMSEYTPVPDPKLGGGGGPLYAKAIVEDLIPWMGSEYRLANEREETGIAGSSLGGLISLWMGFEYPEIFGKVGALSPSLWWNGRSLLSDAGKLALTSRPRIWLDMGLEEGALHLRNTDLLARTLTQRGWVSGRDLHYQRVWQGTHSEASWASRFAEVLSFLHPAPKPSRNSR
ncbi:alpha/beta hydrolase [Terriglobus saanensis]|uniref:Esterase n=1 Tax=Terriglobus saanensis (strain ATCC BAA-1853 / DSM 23119 / SP1PR4) TaxID=401053 RepID=E8V8G7_TERSS|nr:alpha/beta hydrolase-fold protein [Terriglobus saanensis]ADV82946.1 esterase [Terriglobus saanensis SP1PR4]